MKRWVLAGVFCVLAGACQDSALAPIGLEEEILHDGALGRTIERDTDAPMQTDSLVYHMTRGGGWRSVTIRFRYRNDTGETIYISNCHGGLNIGLEKEAGGEWKRVYSPILLLCVSQPITIAPDEIVEYAASVSGALPGRNSAPILESVEPDAEYRLVWVGLGHQSGDSTQGVGPLHSNPFLLVPPSNE